MQPTDDITALEQALSGQRVKPAVRGLPPNGNISGR